MSTSLSSLADNLSEGVHNNKCIDCKSSLKHILTKNNLIISKCLKCKKYYSKGLIKRFGSIYEFCDAEIYRFILLLRKDIYPYEYMDGWERLHEALLPKKYLKHRRY